MNSRLIALVVAALCAAGWNARAAWGSIHNNNRSYGTEHGGEHGAVRGGGGEHHVETVRPEHREAPAVHVEPNRREEHVRVEPRHEDIEREARERRRWDFDEERRHAYFWSDYYAGLPVVTLPPGYISVQVGGVPYDYYQGVFYQPSQSGYVVAAPPPGAVVPALPPGAEALAAGPTTYYYAGGAFYIQQPQGFVVVLPPLGVTVSYLPPGAIPVTVNGAVYYQANGVYFLPVMENGVTVYQTARP